MYYSTEYLQLQNTSDSLSFYLVDRVAKSIQAQIHFVITEGTAISFRFSPFGSFNSTGLEETIASKFLEAVESKLQSKQVHRVVLKHPAPIYPTDQFWLALLKRYGYHRLDQTNHHIPVDQDPFEQNLHTMQRRKLRKSKSLLFKLEPESKFNEVYDFISGCRYRQGRTLSMSRQDLGRVVKGLPQHFLFPTVTIKDQIVSASVIIKASSAVWYNFYPAHDAEFDSLSPLVYLLSQLYGYAQNSKIKAIDLGTSDVGGQAQPGLMQFKSRIGGLITQKPTFTKDF